MPLGKFKGTRPPNEEKLPRLTNRIVLHIFAMKLAACPSCSLLARAPARGSEVHRL